MGRRTINISNCFPGRPYEKSLAARAGKRDDIKELNGVNDRPNNPLYGMTLETILERLVDCYGWNGLYERIEVRCFYNDPNINASLKFLRRTPWVRERVEALYLEMIGK
jgi:uncharacterized protein (DUF2132 family)